MGGRFTGSKTEGTPSIAHHARWGCRHDSTMGVIISLQDFVRGLGLRFTNLRQGLGPCLGRITSVILVVSRESAAIRNELKTMRYEDLPKWSKKAAEWAADYHASLSDRPVRPVLEPGKVLAQIADSPPESGEAMEAIFDDFTRIIPEAMTHWQHPRFFAYFSSNAAPASMLAEQLANAISSQCMLWQTSPAATELETAMVDWLRQALGLPEPFRGVIQDTATTTTLSAVLTMREHALDWKGNESGLADTPPLRIYASAQTHSSIDKAVRLAGIGQRNLVKIPTDAQWAMSASALAEAIRADRRAGFLPAGVIGCIGGTSIGASDRLNEVSFDCERRRTLLAR